MKSELSSVMVEQARNVTQTDFSDYVLHYYGCHPLPLTHYFYN